MIEKYNTLKRMLDNGVVAVVRAENAEQAIKIAEAVKNGGIESIEITLTVPGAIDVIKELKKAYPNNEVIIGAGTVLDSETARVALLAGAEYIVSPNLNLDVVRLCNRYQKICMPGAMTLKEIIEAMEAGADVVKLFPGNVFGPSMVKAIKGPIPYANIMPTGGVTISNVGDWIKAGCVAVGVGGELTAGAKTGDYALVTQTARAFVEAVRTARIE
ncbi:MAG: bifunctional 2-keto-4-hydroxyglutarate aldolase/2-keto-3-deoxy-6-phosphogluconate aldolase [Peptostreptococcaceae bacterium]|nr:bifunctional 2-keto-4-hydroxyglutarate aldolase/2-keto-3-deoxy-6-phosphogluconate aldolase [Peptostreptococcaceae bacterium]